MDANDSSSLYSRLEASSRSKKGLRSLANIKGSVDIVLKGHHDRTLASVAKVCCDHFGGPKYQSICNNSEYRAYIDARFIEARAASMGSRSNKSLPSMEAEAIINVLSAEVRVLSEENNRLRKAFKTVAPVSAELLVNPGAVRSLPTEPESPKVTREEQRDLKNFIQMAYDLGFNHSPDGRLTTSKGFTVIGRAGMAALRRLAGL